MLSRSQPFSAGILSTLVKNVVVFSRAVVILPSPQITLINSPRPPPLSAVSPFSLFWPASAMFIWNTTPSFQLSTLPRPGWRLEAAPTTAGEYNEELRSFDAPSSSRVTSHNTIRRYIFAHCVSLFRVRFKYGAVRSRSWPLRVVDAPFKAAWGAHHDGT